MTTEHRILIRSASDLGPIPDASVGLVVTSPPYPMIEMWDDAFAAQDARIGDALLAQDGARAFDLMHDLLDRVWSECHRVLRDGGFLCVNVGDATRTIGAFRLFTNHARVVGGCESIGFMSLPAIVWRKPTNSPTKFMGSGMLPAGAYVTLEHEYILVFRKGGKRAFGPEQQARRRESAFFWEERNVWFSDVWDLVGTRQPLQNTARQRSAAFPREIAFRLVAMYSAADDLVLDPFAGTGTTLVAAAALGRNSVGVEIDASLAPLIAAELAGVPGYSSERQRQRLHDHLGFVRECEQSGRRELRYRNTRHDIPVMTRQEVDLVLLAASVVEPIGEASFRVEYETL